MKRSGILFVLCCARLLSGGSLEFSTLMAVNARPAGIGLDEAGNIYIAGSIAGDVPYHCGGLTCSALKVTANTGKIFS